MQIDTNSREFKALSRLEQVRLITDGMHKLNPELMAQVRKDVRENVERAVQAGAFSTKH